MGKLVYLLFILFGTIAIILVWYLLLDILITSITFVFSGNFDSILQRNLENIAPVYGALTPEGWRLDSGLKGLDLIINSFIGLQFTVTGRWIMFALSSGISATLVIVCEIFDLEQPHRENPEKREYSDPIDRPIGELIPCFTGAALMAPVVFGGLFGFFL